MSFLDGTIDSPQAVDFFEQQIARMINKCDREEEHAAFCICIVRHMLSWHAWKFGRASLLPTLRSARDLIAAARVGAPHWRACPASL